MIEREIKQMLSIESYNHVLNSSIFDKLQKKRQIQINYYYDTSNYDLYHNDITLRVRQKDHSLNMELKYPIENNGMYRVKREKSNPISQLPLTIDLGANYEELQLNDMARLTYPLVTERTSIRVTDHIVVDLDKNSYLGITDYELEIEFQSGGFEEAYEVYTSLLPNETIQSDLGKNARFFKHYFQIQQSDNK